MNKPSVSLCMIVKNEEEFIEQCLSSVKDVVDEIIIVDTGSTDKTIEICRTFNATIETFEWNGSFADARNYGIAKAKGDWILWLDADEELDQKDWAKLRDGDHFEKYDVLTIHLVNYYGEKVDKDKTTDVAHTRLFRRDTGIQFINKIHECLDVGSYDPSRIGHIGLKVYHYGYLDPIVDKKGKYERNLKMLELQLEEKENVFWAQYYIAMEYYRKQEFKEAFERVNLSIKAFLEEGVLPPSMVYKLKYSILISMGSFEGAWPGIERAIALYPDYVDLRFFKGLILYSLEKYEPALETFKECIVLGEDNINHLVMRGVGTFQAWHYKGLCEEKLGKNHNAARSYMKSMCLSPNYKFAQEALTELVKKTNTPVKTIAKQYFKGENYQFLQSILEEIQSKK